MGTTCFFGGMPTQPDVTRLVDLFGAQPAVGTQFEHAQVEAALGLQRPKDECRYRTVTTAWRAYMLRTNGIEIGAVRGVGFEVLSDTARVAGGVQGVRHGARKQLRSIHRAALVNTENETLLRKQMALNRLGMVLKAEMTGFMRQIEPPKTAPEERMPRPQPPQQLA